MIVNIRAAGEATFKKWRLNDLFIKTVFSINILSSSFKNMVAFE